MVGSLNNMLVSYMDIFHFILPYLAKTHRQ